MPEVWDAIIVGAGPAGSSLAARLGRLGRSVLLLDSARFPRSKMCGEFLGAGCVPLLDEVGVLRDVLRQAHPVSVLKAHSRGGFAFRARYPEGVCGLSLRREQLDSILLDCARRHKTVVVREGFRAEQLLIREGGVSGVRGRLPACGEETHRARITVGADGRNSIVARGLGVFRWHASHRKLALGLHYEDVRPAEQDVEIYAGRGLYGILNHQAGGVANVSVVVEHAGLGAWKGRLAAWYDFLLGQLPALRERLETARALEGIRALGPLAHYATRVSAGGALLVGDAAGFYDPFTGEGVYMALEGARLAADAIASALEACSFSSRFLARYDAARAASLASRYRLQALIQAILGRPRLADFTARRLQTCGPFADSLMGVTGGLRRPGDLLARMCGFAGLG